MPCDVSDVPFCGWGDALPPSLFDQMWAPLTQEQFDAMEFDYIDERLSMVTLYGVSGMRALDVLDAAEDAFVNIPWLSDFTSTSSLGRLAMAVAAWREAKADENPKASTEGDDRG